MADYPVLDPKHQFDPKILAEIGKALGAFIAASRHIKDRYYKDKIVNLDGYSFTNCCFENCVLRTNTGAFVLRSCRLISCTSEFGSYAVHVVQLFHVGGPYSAIPGFNPSVQFDGLVTIA